MMKTGPTLGRWILPPIPVAAGAVALLIFNVWLLVLAAFEMPYALDWAIIERAARLAGDPDLYAPHGTWTFVWSPVAAYVLQLITPLGLTLWRILTVVWALAMPTWRLRLLVLVSGPFWLDFATGNIVTLIFLSAAWSLRGSRIATAGFLVLAVLIPRPLMVPIVLWLLWHRPEWRVPFSALVVVHAALVLTTGLGPEWISTTLAVGPEIQTTSWNLSPTRWLGWWWLLLGVPLAAWFTWKGRLGIAGLVASPYIWPYYLLFALQDVSRSPASPKQDGT